MKYITISLLTFTLSLSVLAQGQAPRMGPTALGETANLPVERIGADDLVGITVYDSPELTRTVRVSSEGEIRLPMLKHNIRAAGLYPAELEKAITAALVGDQVLVDPIVTVSVVEYRSRPISVSGAVKHPVTFQATGNVTLLDAISQAEGLAENAGAEILVTYQASREKTDSVAQTTRISARGLMSGEDPSLNLHLEGGEEIRVPEAGRVFVVGNVRKPGAFYITDGSESSIMKALALSEGLDSFSAHKAYIYRLEAGSAGRNEIPVDLKKIMNRQMPDVSLVANDILYIPTASGLKASMRVLESSLGIGTALGTSLIYINR